MQSVWKCVFDTQERNLSIGDGARQVQPSSRCKRQPDDEFVHAVDRVAHRGI